MKKSDLRSMVNEMVQEALEALNGLAAEEEQATLQEKLEGPGYSLKVWAAPEDMVSGSPSFDSVKSGIIYPEFDEVLDALKSTKLAEQGAYEIVWVKTGEATE